MKYALMIFQNPGAFEALPDDERAALMKEFEAFNKEIEESGEFIGGNALAHPDNAKTVRGRDGRSGCHTSRWIASPRPPSGRASWGPACCSSRARARPDGAASWPLPGPARWPFGSPRKGTDEFRRGARSERA